MEHIRRTILIIMCAVLVLFHLPAIAETAGQSSSSNDESLEITDAGSLTITGSKYVAKGKSVTLKASEAVTWSTSNKKTATVSAKGVVKGIKAGKVKITATSKSNPKVKKTWTMTVKDKAVSKVTIKAAKTELDPDETITLKATASPSEAAQSFEWKSSNSKVATVNEKGKVKAVSAGKAKITAAATDGSKKKATITITVKKTNPPQTGKKVGISMPTKDLRWWELAGESMASQLTNNGFDVDTQYASNDIYNQVVQIESMIDNGADILVIAAIDPSSLGTVLDKAGDQGVKVIAYERLLLDSINVDYYVTFNYYMIKKIKRFEGL